ncbi:MAG: DUF4278 domain-containing protein [Lyngbya sp. HA4199-MV5]|jgi:hypothetical protein|nr:DUF4278 domain-containing protein [Lyngbya sp. HA4199-MV5]
MKLTYRGITYDRYPFETSGHSFQQVRAIAPTTIPDSLTIHKLSYRGVTYYKLSYQGINFSRLSTK